MNGVSASAMSRETREAPQAVARLLARELPAITALGRRLSDRAPPVVVTCARGSSDHAAGYFKYLLEIGAGIPVASLGPSVASIYGAKLRMQGGVLLTVSQSGRSPDLVALQQAARAAGALTVAIVNATDGPVAGDADVVLPLHAGAETSVAATKSFVSSLVALASLVAAWTGDSALASAVSGLPDALDRALAVDWSAARAALAQAASLYVVGRGPAFPIAQEAALKSKETAAIHAEAFSAAEVMHGPLRLVGARLPVVAMLPDDAARPSSMAALERIALTGAPVFAVSAGAVPGRRLPTVATGHGFADPIAMIVSFYVLIEQVCRDRGFDPDTPANLRKVTETL